MNKKEAIKKSALKLLVEKGVHNTPMSEIAKEAGTGMGTIYNYFPNKELLINSIYVDIKDQEEEVFNSVDTEQSTMIQFQMYMQVLIDFLIQNPRYFHFLGQMESSPLITEENLMKGRKTVDMVIVLLKKGQDAGVIKNMEVSQLIVFIGGAVRASASWHIQNDKNKNEFVEQHISLIWDAISA